MINSLEEYNNCKAQVQRQKDELSILQSAIDAVELEVLEAAAVYEVVEEVAEEEIEEEIAEAPVEEVAAPKKGEKV